MSQIRDGAEIAFEGATPILRVQNLEASIGYYVHQLGFKLNWQSSGFACVSRGRCSLFLSQGDQGHVGTWVWVGVGDADALLEQYRRTGAKIRHLPANYSWAYEMQVEDLDGNVLRLGSDSKSDMPIGEWLDMRGDRWVMVSESEWKRVDRE